MKTLKTGPLKKKKKKSGLVQHQPLNPMKQKSTDGMIFKH